MAKSFAIVSGVENIENVTDADILLTLMVWFFDDVRPDQQVMSASVAVQFDSAAPQTTINQKIVAAITTRGQELNFVNLNRKDVMLPAYTRG